MPGLLTALIIKHFITDFPLQTQYQFANKGKLFHPGGLLHAGITIAGTAVVFLLFGVPLNQWPLLLGVEFVVHYCTDLTKVRLNDRMGWTPGEGNSFFILLGFDQMVHYLTYIWIVWQLTGQLA